MILNRGINYDQIMFTDECIIDLSAYTNDSIRLDPEMQEELKNGRKEVYNLINREKRKFEKSLMIAGGISYYGLSHLIFLEGTMNDFAYGQALLFFKDDIDAIRDKYGVKLIFEQDGAAVHKTRANITLLNRLFGENGWVQNSPNSPDLAYPIEDLWSIVKPRVKRRNPCSIEELKLYLLEEWNSVPIELVQNLCKGFLIRINKALELNGGRLEPEHLKKKITHNTTYYWETPATLPNMRVVYNNKKFYKYKKKELKIIRSELKKIQSMNVDRMKNKTPDMNLPKKQMEYSTLIREVIVSQGLEKAKKVKKRLFNDTKNMINKIKGMSLIEYIEHLKKIVEEKTKKEKIKREKDENMIRFDDDNSKAIINEIIVEQKITKLLELRKFNKRIRYKIKF